MLPRALLPCCSHRLVALVGLVLLFSFGLLALPPGQGAEPEALRIGMSKMIFHEMPESSVKDAMESLTKLIKKQTGMRGELITEPDLDKLGQDLEQQKLDMAVFQGYEFAWARQNHPKFQSLVIAVNQTTYLRAHVMVRQDSKATGLADLKDKPFALPQGSRASCKLFLQSKCDVLGKPPAGFFGGLTAPATLEDGLDDVVDGQVQGAVVDTYCLDCYKRRKPARFRMLKEVQQSEVFPSPVVAYLNGAIDATTLKRFREGMLKTHQTPDGRDTLTLWKLTAFDAVPEDYEKAVADIGKAYPPPARGKK